MITSRKYCRTLHAQISKGTSSDDRFMPDNYVQYFAQMPSLVLTEKLDGQNNCLSKQGVFARSHTAASVHPWDKPLWERWELCKRDLKDLEIFGENMYGLHSIEYKKLASYFYVFAIREKEYWYSWEEVKFYARLLDFPTVPEIAVPERLGCYLQQEKDENKALANWLTSCLSVPWEEAVEQEGELGGWDPKNHKPCCEGFVIRNADGFVNSAGPFGLASNEFSQLMKLVRKSHVQTDVHWTKTWKPARLVDYSTYKWDIYQHLSFKD